MLKIKEPKRPGRKKLATYEQVIELMGKGASYTEAGIALGVGSHVIRKRLSEKVPKTKTKFCELCGVKTPYQALQGHHIDYRTNNVLWLCRCCHGLLHAQMRGQLRNKSSWFFGV